LNPETIFFFKNADQSYRLKRRKGKEASKHKGK
jgi:hypothetical protein